MNNITKQWYFTILWLLLIILIFELYIVRIQPIINLWEGSRLDNLSINLSYLQLVVWIIVGVWALFIANKQMNISEKQIKMSQREIELETIKFKIDKKKNFSDIVLSQSATLLQQMNVLEQKKRRLWI